MNYPSRTDTHEVWKAWIESVAPWKGPCHPELHADLRFLCNTEDRELATVAAQCAVNSIRGRRSVIP